MTRFEDFSKKAWDRYITLTPDAPKVHQLLETRGERIINDHMAFRTFNLPGIGRLELGRIFEELWGYQKREDLDFTEKKLKATYYVHPDPELPKVFISELLTEQFSKELQDWITSFTAPVRPKKWKHREEIFLEPSWEPVRFEEYQKFYPTSEYASWTAAFGIQLNHFTVLVNSLKSFKSLPELNEFLLKNGFTLNQAGGIVKGTPSELLEQSSTMAREIPWTFAGGERKDVLGCYYEFARRYELPGTGKLFEGFIPKSADKIFESTFKK